MDIDVSKLFYLIDLGEMRDLSSETKFKWGPMFFLFFRKIVLDLKTKIKKTRFLMFFRIFRILKTKQE